MSWLTVIEERDSSHSLRMARQNPKSCVHSHSISLRLPSKVFHSLKGEKWVVFLFLRPGINGGGPALADVRIQELRS